MAKRLRSMDSRYRYRVAALALAAGLLSACGTEQEPTAQQEPPPAPVTLATVNPESVEIEAEYAGRVRGSRELEVRARVDGVLEERLYDEGQVLEKGAPLFRIDAEPFEIALQSAGAERADAAASLEQARRDWERLSGLFEQDAISRRERDQAQTNLRLAEARLALAEAAVADAERNLRYTEVRAPVTGATGLETLPEGSLIERGTLLTTMTQHNPAHVRFGLPEGDAAVQRLARRAMSNGDGEYQYEARVRLPNGEWYESTGQVDFTASTIDPRTGMVSARAIFGNPKGELVPGQFVRIRLVLNELDDVFLIDPVAVGEGPEGPQVFVVDEQNQAHARAVELGPQVKGKQVVLAGLNPGDRLVVNGQVALRDGVKVSATAREGTEG